jgi:hypothetical protein
MKEKLTKFQTKVWQTIEPIIKKESYQVNLTFDDEFVIIKESKYVITIFPKKQISIKNKNESIFFDETNLNGLISFLES